jgi:lipopolysaccharide export system protein LptA
VTWQRRARLVLALVALSVIGVVAYTLRPRETRVAPPPVARLDPKSTVETRGGDVIQLKGARENLRVAFQGQVTYADGRTKLLDVKVMVDNRGGRSYTIVGKEARVGEDQNSFDVAGDVALETSDGLTAYGASATYTDAEKIVRVPGSVRFTQGRMSGSGVGFTYDEQRDIVTLLDQAVMHFAPEGDQGSADVTAGALTYARADRYLHFERTVHMTRGTQVVDAAEATVHLLKDRDEPDLVELRGNASVKGGSDLGALSSLVARDITLDYREDGRSLQQATLAGGAAIELAGKDGGAGQRLNAELVDIALAEDGSVRAMSGRDNVQVALPATREAGARTIRGASVSASGTSAGLTAMRFADRVVYTEAASGERGPRTARARNLDAALNPSTGTVDDAHFTGGFSFEDGTLKASSAEARYTVTRGALSLSGRAAGRPPSASDPNLTLDAESIDVTLEPRAMTAKGRVTSVLQPSAETGGNATAAKRPALLGERDPVNIVAETLTYDEATRNGTYTGAPARLFQGDTVIQADALTLDESEGSLSAKGRVYTALSVGSRESGVGSRSGVGNERPAKPETTKVNAGSFTYADRTRQAVYQTGVHMNGAQGELWADSMTLTLAPKENALTGLEAAGQLRATVEKRQVTGTRLVYTPDGDKYVVTGAPVRMVDAECQETTGKTLTFFKGSDRALIDGNQEIRTQTKGGGKCTPPPPSR